ncbi:MarR family transcriptional regulator [Lutimonas vermicola]|uniref:MarR family transcriptional regulator n=1 Tax=Lutimonas vermicola TaxID=414288 RepID=A0ABU9KZZ7_9FLAO
MFNKTQDPLSLIPWIGKTAKFMDYYIGDYMKSRGIDLSKEQFIVLKYLNESDGRKQNDLAFITNRSKTALTRLINTMEKKGLVSRSICEKDMRINHIYLTPSGREIWAMAYPVFLEIIQELQQGISEEDILLVQEVMKQIQKNINLKTTVNQ